MQTPGTGAGTDWGDTPELLRFLMPSPIGSVAMELVGGKVTRVLINPKKTQRKGFVSFAELEGSDFCDELFGRLSEYFAGARTNLRLSPDFGASGVGGFARRVLKETTKIPYGRTRTYGDLAVAAGRPDAYRMVLAALMENPIPIVVPCHRVVTNKSGIGSWIGGKEKKRWLLSMERETLRRRARGDRDGEGS
jgi:methylated-DNA-[protein]-cysteine S-methyltransferase